MIKKTYLEKLKDPKWQKLRLKIFERDEFMCQYCGDKDQTLNVHHKLYIYDNDIWDYPLTNFITLCEDCHSSISSLKKEFKLLVDNNFDSFDWLSELYNLALKISELKLNPYDMQVIYNSIESTLEINKKNGTPIF